MSNQAANGSTAGLSTKTSSTNQTCESNPESKSSPTTSKCSTSKHEPGSPNLPSKSFSIPPSSPKFSETLVSASLAFPADTSLEIFSSPKNVHDCTAPISIPSSFQHPSPPSSEKSTSFSPNHPEVVEMPPDSPSALGEAQDYELSSTLKMFLNDETHIVSTYGPSYINALVYTYGFPDDQSSQEEIELEMVIEAELRVRRLIERFDRQMEAVGS